MGGNEYEENEEAAGAGAGHDDGAQLHGDARHGPWRCPPWPMAMPAMAHGDEDEGVMPLYEESTCPKHGVMERVTSRESTRLVPANHGIGAHDHYQRIITYTYECGYTYISVLSDTCLG